MNRERPFKTALQLGFGRGRSLLLIANRLIHKAETNESWASPQPGDLKKNKIGRKFSHGEKP
jgi:hypothetical protein